MNILLLLISLASPVVFAQNHQYHEIARYSFGGAGGWDYLAVDASTRKLLIARMNRIMVINADTGALLGEVSGLNGAHGVAWVPGSNQIFATSGISNEVMVIDLATAKIKNQIKVGEKPDAIFYDAFSKDIFAFNGKGKSVSVIDPVKLTVVHTLTLTGKPEFATGDENGHVFVNIEDQNEVQVIDSKSFKLLKPFPLKPCEEPTGIAISSETKKLIVGCGNKTSVVVDSKSGKVLQTFKTGEGVDAVAYDPVRKVALISAGEGKLTILKEEKNEFVLAQELKTVPGARTLAVDPKSGAIFLPAAEFEALQPGANPNGHSRSLKKDSFYVLVVGTNTH